VAVLAEQEEKAAGVREQDVVEFMLHVLRSDIGGLRSEMGKLSERQDARFKELLERQDQTFARLEEKIDRRIDGLYHVVIWVLVTALGSVAMGILGLVLR
jgi:hypothetical protein